MHSFRTFLARLATVLACAAPLAAMNNTDLIKLQEAGLAEETILLSIAREPADYNLTPGGLVELKKGGISDAIIQKLMGAQSTGAASQRPAAAPATPALPLPGPAASAPAPATPELATPAPAPTPGTEVPAPPAGGFFSQEFPSVAVPYVGPVIGADYFTRYTLRQEDNEFPTTNYARGLIVPINTPVKVVSMAKDKILLKRLDTGEELAVKNVEKYSRKSLGEIARLLLASEKTPVENLPPEMAAAIRNGDPRKGMTKEQVILARGFPPGHETPSSESDRWVYWSSRFVKQTLVFSNGRLVEGRGIY